MTFGKTEVHLRTIGFFAKLFGAMAAIAAIMYAVTTLFSLGVALFVFLVLPFCAMIYYFIYSTYETEMITDKIWEESFKARRDQSSDQPHDQLIDQLRDQLNDQSLYQHVYAYGNNSNNGVRPIYPRRIRTTTNCMA